MCACVCTVHAQAHKAQPRAGWGGESGGAMTKALTLRETDGIERVFALALDGLASERSRHTYRRALERFLDWYDGQGRPGLTKATLQAYKAHLLSRNLSASTVNVALSAVRRLAVEAADAGLLDERTLARLRRVPNVKGETVPAGRSIAPGELAGLMLACTRDPSAAGVRDAALIGLLYVTGARRSEVVGLDVADYAPDTGALTIRHGKGGKQRIVYVTNGAAAALSDWLQVRGDEAGALFWPVNKGGRMEPRRMTSQALWYILEKRAAEAGIADVRPHDFRRSCVSDLLDGGADLATVQKLMGHASPTTTARYDRRPEEAKRAAAARLHVPYYRRSEQLPLGAV